MKKVLFTLATLLIAGFTSTVFAQDQTPTPTIVNEVYEDYVSVDVEGEGNIRVWVNGKMFFMSLPAKFDRIDEDYTVAVKATAQADGMTVSEAAIDTIFVPALGHVAPEQAEGKWVVLIDQNGKEYPFELLMPEGADGYSTLIKVYYGEKWGTTPYTTSVDENGKTIVDIPNPLFVNFYYIIDGVKYYADKDQDTMADTSTADNNPLTNDEGRDHYIVEVGYAWTFGLELYKDGIWHAFVTKGSTAVDELAADKAVASTRYFNVAGQEMSEANGLTIVVTTYTDGTTTATKVIK